MTSNAWRKRPFAPSAGTPLCGLSEIPGDNGLQRVFGDAPLAFRVAIFKVGEEVRAYVNECPHAGVELNFGADTFCVYEIDGQRDLMCPYHAALFHLSDGYCYEGPCRGDGLEPVPVKVVGEQVLIA